MRYPLADFVGADPHDFSTSPISHKRIVIHVAQGQASGTINWFHNPKSYVSAHLLNPKVGKMVQFVDLDQMAYHCAQWNDSSIGIEHEGFSGEPMNRNQLNNLKAFLKWAQNTYKYPLVFTTDPNSRGIIGHGFLPEGSLSHPNCPGGPILIQVEAMLRGMRIVRALKSPITSLAAMAKAFGN